MQEPLRYDRLLELSASMRERDWAEVQAVYPHDKRRWAADMADPPCSETEAIFSCDGIPVAACGYRPVRTRVWTAWLVGTDDIKLCGGEIHRFALRKLDFLVGRVDRIVAVGIDGYAEGERWMRRLGMIKEGVSKYSGLHGEHMATWAWVRGMPGPKMVVPDAEKWVLDPNSRE